MNANELKNVSDATLKGKAINDIVNGVFGGTHQVATMVIGADITDRDTFSISGLGVNGVDETYELAVIATDTGVNIGDELASDTSVATFTTTAAHNVAKGAIVRCENEYMLVTAVPSTTSLTVTRGYAGSTAATHADASDLFEQEATALTANTVTIPVQAVTVATMDNELVSAFNALQGNDITATLSAAGLVTLSRVDDGKTGTLAKTFTSGSNTLDAAFRNGGEAGSNKVSIITRVPTAAEVTNGAVTVVAPFAVSHVWVDIVATATYTTLAWDGAIALSGNAITLDNSGTADWDANDTIRIVAFG
jgi:hypothetical protein